MADARSENSKSQIGRLGSSLMHLSSLALWSERSGNNIKKNGYSFFLEERNGIEVIHCQDVEEGGKSSSHCDPQEDVQKLELRKDIQRRKTSIKIVMIVTAMALILTSVCIGIQEIKLAKNETSSKNLEENYTTNIGAWKESENEVDDFDVDPDVDIYFKNNNGDAAFPEAIPNFNDASVSKNNEYSSGQAPKQQDTLPPKEMPGTTTTVESEEIVVLYPNEYLEAGQFRYSPNGRFKVGLTEHDGNFVLIEVDPSAEAVIWSASTDLGLKSFSTLKSRCFMQSDGNLVLRDSQTRESLWMTRTHGNLQARLVLDNFGRVAVRSGDESRSVLWMDGVPRDQYTSPSSEDMTFPIRGAFYYPWYPSTWHVDGHRAHYNTSLGMYSSGDPAVADAHIDAMDYGKIQLSIASWWGPGTNLDRARLTMLMDETVAQKSPLKWTIYHEDERDYDPTPEELRKDFDYLKKWFAWHEAWAHIDGKPVIFVYNESGCDVASRWMQASRGEWYVVLKLFGGFEDCPDQPESWHQYGVGKQDGVVHNPGHSFVVSPGFWKADTDIPLLKRLTGTQFCQNTKNMDASGEPWQLIVSFNEAGEGTLIEPSPDWKSDSGYGDYLDCLHENS